MDGEIAELKTDMKEVKADVAEIKSSADMRFDHVYGAVADLNADVADMRNMLATLIAKLG